MIGSSNISDVMHGLNLNKRELLKANVLKVLDVIMHIKEEIVLSGF